MGASKASYQFRLEGIGKLISDRFFSVPIYQRSYSWTSDHVEEFWHDINDALTSGKTEYFLGTTVLTDTTDKTLSSVIDGQQRISTTIIMFSALQKFLNEEGDTRNAQHIRDHYVAASTFGSANDRARIRMNTDDDPLFYSHIVSQKDHIV